jgi:NAD(P)-dependent dehydrogenase (short-subunit alcohol dehydrogenase family)
MTSDKPIAAVTGGGNGIGEACARRLADDYSIAVIDQDADRAKVVAKDLEGGAYACDVASEEEVEDCIARVEAEMGAIGALVTSAGIIQERPFRPEEFDQQLWDRVLAVNLRGTWLCCRAVGNRMAKRRRGSIVTIGSIAAYRSWPTHSYAASKSAVVALTQGLASEWGPSGVRVNAVSPGFTATPRLKEIIALGRDLSAVINTTPLQRMIEPKEIADAVAFLCSDRASAITGVNLPVDGGWLGGVNWVPFGGLPAPK